MHPATAQASELSSASIPGTLAALKINPETGLTRAEVATLRKEHGYNKVAEHKDHTVLLFLGKFWGLSAWMLELIMVLSLILGKYSDLAVVSALLVVNAVLSFIQEYRAAGVVDTLRQPDSDAAPCLSDNYPMCSLYDLSTTPENFSIRFSLDTAFEFI